MYIFLYLLAETGTTVAKGVTILKQFSHLLIEVGDKGYTIDNDKFMELADKHIKEMRSKGKIASRVISFVPFVNYAYTKNRWKKVINKITDDPEFESTLRPLTEEEKEKYANVNEGSKLANKLKRATLVLDYSKARKEDPEFDEKHGLVSTDEEEKELDDEDEKIMMAVLDDRLVPLAYTLDEVKKLNNATEGTLRLGTVDGSHIAIVGVPEDAEPFEKVKLADCPQDDETFIPLTEEECKDEKFLVYPYSGDYKRTLEWAVESIMKDRKIASEIPRIDFQPTASDEPLDSVEHKAPTLMKSIGRMKF